jgi:hypothetical protein
MEEIRNVCRIYSENLETDFGNIGVDARFLLKWISRAPYRLIVK